MVTRVTVALGASAVKAAQESVQMWMWRKIIARVMAVTFSRTKIERVYTSWRRRT